VGAKKERAIERYTQGDVGVKRDDLKEYLDNSCSTNKSAPVAKDNLYEALKEQSDENGN
jgi:hypothetical protein